MVTYTIQRSTGLEYILEGKTSKSCVSPSRPAHYTQSFSVNFSLFDLKKKHELTVQIQISVLRFTLYKEALYKAYQKFSTAAAIIHIHNAPFAQESFPVLSPITFINAMHLSTIRNLVKQVT